ncbi:MAG: hypothetical protein IKQ77_12530, partial [Prevotella sp.]|nr:hypothetical protein [Prevotella sp.]
PRPSRGGVRGGVCNFNAKRQCPHLSVENVILEKRKNNLWGEYLTPAPCGQAQDLTLQRGGDMRTHLLLTTN